MLKILSCCILAAAPIVRPETVDTTRLLGSSDPLSPVTFFLRLRLVPDTLGCRTPSPTYKFPGPISRPPIKVSPDLSPRLETVGLPGSPRNFFAVYRKRISPSVDQESRLPSVLPSVPEDRSDGLVKPFSYVIGSSGTPVTTTPAPT